MQTQDAPEGRAGDNTGDQAGDNPGNQGSKYDLKFWGRVLFNVILILGAMGSFVAAFLDRPELMPNLSGASLQYEVLTSESGEHQSITLEYLDKMVGKGKHDPNSLYMVVISNPTSDSVEWVEMNISNTNAPIKHAYAFVLEGGTQSILRDCETWKGGDYAKFDPNKFLNKSTFCVRARSLPADSAFYVLLLFDEMSGAAIGSPEPFVGYRDGTKAKKVGLLQLIREHRDLRSSARVAWIVVFLLLLGIAIFSGRRFYVWFKQRMV